MTLFNAPPHTKNAQGELRTTGFEFELAGIEPQACAELLAELFDGNINAKHSLDIDITDTPMGTFTVELDAQMIKNMAQKLEKKEPEENGALLDLNAVRSTLSQWMGELAGQVVPLEIVTPPLKQEQFSKLETLREALRKQKATGTKSAFSNAFGMHINPEIASREVEYIKDIMCAFLVLYPWLKEVMNVDLSRRLLTFIDPFPKKYVKRVLAENYTPSLDDFIEDYLKYNPTRNRALDMLPLFAHLKPEKLNALDNQSRALVKARPTFHYRLPNCEVEHPDWTIARDWNYWVEVEKLAEDKEKLAAITKDYHAFLNEAFHLFNADWIKQTCKKYDYATPQK